jgi:hypothetical protein
VQTCRRSNTWLMVSATVQVLRDSHWSCLTARITRWRSGKRPKDGMIWEWSRKVSPEASLEPARGAKPHPLIPANAWVAALGRAPWRESQTGVSDQPAPAPAAISGHTRANESRQTSASTASAFMCTTCLCGGAGWAGLPKDNHAKGVPCLRARKSWLARNAI